MKWARAQQLRLTFGYGKVDGVQFWTAQGSSTIGVNSLGKVEIGFQWLTAPPLDAVEMRHELPPPAD